MNMNSMEKLSWLQGSRSMIHILICDDDPTFTSLLAEKIVHQPSYSKRRMKVECINNPTTITSETLRKVDILFLDIDMGSINGMKLAKHLRKHRKDAVLIFVTNYGEYAAEGYEVNAFRFLSKLKLDEKLPLYFEQALAECQARSRVLSVMCQGEEVAIPLDRLIYAATANGLVEFHLDDADRPIFLGRITMHDLEQKLEEDGFLRVHKEFLVNMMYIRKLLSSGVTLQNGEKLMVSMHNYPKIKKKYMEWKGMA